MAISAKAKKLKENKVKLNVEVPVDDVNKSIDAAFERLSKKINIPGFRKGKIPRSVIEARIGIEPAIEEALNEMVPKWYLEAVDITGIKPIDRPQIDFGDEYKPEKVTVEPLKFEATVEVKPEVKLGSYEDLKIEKEPTNVSKEDIEGNLNLLRDRFAKLEPIAKGKIKAGDFALIDFKGIHNEEIVTQSSDHLVEVGGNTLLKEFEDNLIGLKKSDKKEFEIDLPQEYHRLDLAGQRVKFEASIKEIKKKVLPELNDDFAKEISEYGSLDELKKEIKKDIEELKKQQSDMAFRREILKKVSDDSDVQIPEILINVRTEELFREFSQSLTMRGVTLDQLLENTGRTSEEMLADFRTEATIQVKNELILDAISRKEKLDITEEELFEELKKGAERFGKSPEELRQQVRDQGTEEIFKEAVLREKALDLLAKRTKPLTKKKKSQEISTKKTKTGKKDTKSKKKED